MNFYVRGFQETYKTHLPIVGGKGANLGELSRIEGILVPVGFCVTTEAYKKITENNLELEALLDELSRQGAENREQIQEISKRIRILLESIAITKEIADEIIRNIKIIGEDNSYAVRSSATSEDLPTASFAGQQDTYLNVIGKDEILKHISKCWTSLFTERAVAYRIKNGFDHRKVYLSVIVQKMVFPKAAGIMFTADPITSNRKVLSIDASFGLGEALVSGLVTADNYRVQEGKVLDKVISTKKLAVYGSKAGGTETQELDENKQTIQVLTEEEILKLEGIGRRIEKHFSSPQDIEWCLADGEFYIVQSRPITTLYPIPEADDEKKHIYLSVGHQQMMTDPLKPLGMSIFQLTSMGQRFKAGGRLFVDVIDMLESPEIRDALLRTMGEHDPLTKDALVTITEREDFVKALPDDKKKEHTNSIQGKEIDNNPSIVSDLIKRSEKYIDELKEKIQQKSGRDLFEFIKENIEQLKKFIFDPQNSAAIMAGIGASSWINERINAWLGEKNAADILSQSVENNITSEMGLALLDVADVIRPYPEVINYLQEASVEDFLKELVKFEGGKEVQAAINDYLVKYGMRCVGEIDITKTRWSEKPQILIPTILSNIKKFQPGARAQKFNQGLQEAYKKEKELIRSLRQLPDGEEKAQETIKMIDRLRIFIGYREYPKYHIANRYFIYKMALMKETEKLALANVIKEKEDAYFLTFEELNEALVTGALDYEIIVKRKEEYKLYEKLTPPRVITSDGEIITGKYNREDIPPTAIAGLAVSAGVVEGRARVILNMEDAELEEDDILVTTFTDPSWTPLFISIKGLVTEVGGLMTHGAVIAREYGLPAVVGMENATKLIKDGQRIRVHGTEGYVEIL